ncbi:hypothetical protein YDYSY3_37960 [Paenibacillus chitinolyticus]|uniref:hypothetical protein n=1 Tax=Paenibacillus chitinolyticus TaxID=79263 RepID=UPI0026E4F23F|nr:hypothetical protein [Paenibacillus chitinolyticus]GKS12796.1 hypothetical protein YDYSY3_37960 [Paenibacillus chitinolyticus]
MKIWLLDVYKETKALLNEQKYTYFSSLMRSFAGSGFEPLPLPNEFNLIMVDFMNAFDNQNAEREDKRRTVAKLTGKPQPKGVIYLNDATVDQFSYAAQALTPKIKEALEAGIPVVVVGGTYQEEITIDKPVIHSYTWLLNDYPSLKITNFSPNVGPVSIDCVHSDRAVKELHKQFEADLTWEVAFNWERDKPIKFFRRKIDQSPFEPLFENKKKQPVGFALQAFNSELILLPNIRDCLKRSEYIAYILNTFLPQFRPSWFPEKWSGSYEPELLKEKGRLLEIEKEKILEDFKQKEAKIEEQKKRLRSFVDLVTQADDRLVSAVKRSFEDIFSVQVTDLDEIRDTQGKHRLFDLVVLIDGKRIALEIKGGKRSLSKEMLDKVQRNVETYLNESNDRLDGVVLILNDQLAKAPQNREPFASHMIQDAEEREIAVLSTPVLMEIMAMRINNECSQQRFVAALTRPGLVEPPTDK